MQNNISQIFEIQKFLEKINYPDAYRIAREINDFLNIQSKISKDTVINRLSGKEPWEYIRGSVKFCNNEFEIDKNTLIPRVETEFLVYESIKEIIDRKITKIIDIGTGSGCIIISIAKLLENSLPYSFWGIDISNDTLNIAKRNERNILKSKGITWLKSNLVKDIQIDTNTLLIANLPYIPTVQYLNLDSSVKDFEPRLALDGGRDGLLYYRNLFSQIVDKDMYPQLIMMETESTVIDKHYELCQRYFPKAKIEKIKDCFDRDRFLKITF